MSTTTLEKIQMSIEIQTKGAKEEIIKVQAQVTRMTRTVNKEVSKVNNIFKTLFKGISIRDIAVKFGKVILQSTQMAMKVEGSIQQIKRTMGESSNAFLKWSKDNALAYNMSQADAMNYGAKFSEFASTFSTDTKQTMDYTTNLLKASSIISSGTGRTMEDVMDKIKSGILGNMEAIGELGINVSDATIQSSEAFGRFANGKSWDQLSSQTQQQIRLFSILEQTSNKFGGEIASNTSTRLQQLIAILGDVSLNIGNAFLPIVNAVLPILNIFAMGLRTVTGYISVFMQSLFGYTPDANTGVGGASTQVSGLGNAAVDTGKKVKDTQKEVNRLLGGFDEINTISKDESSGETSESEKMGAMPGIGTSIPIGFDIIEPDTSVIIGLADRFKELLIPALAAFENFKMSLEPIIENIGIILIWLWDNILAPFASWTISDVIPAFFNILAGAFEIINPILEVFMELGSWLWDNFLQPIASWTGGVIVEVLNGVADILTNIGIWINDNKPLIENLVLIIGSFALAWGLVNIAIGIWNLIGTIAAAVTGGISIAMGVLSAATAFLTQPIVLVTLAIGALIAIGVLLCKNWEKVKEVACDVFDGIRDFVGGVCDKIKGAFTGLVNGVIGGLNTMIRGLNKLNFDVPDWVPIIGGGSFGFSISELPYLARGGIIDNPTLAVIGEAGKEAVMPLENNTGWITSLADKLSSRMPAETSNNNYDGDLILTIDGSVIGKVALKQLRKMQRQGGIALMPV